MFAFKGVYESETPKPRPVKAPPDPREVFRSACEAAGIATERIDLANGYSGPCVRTVKRRRLFEVGRAYPGPLTWVEDGGEFVVYPAA